VIIRKGILFICSSIIVDDLYIITLDHMLLTILF